LICAVYTDGRVCISVLHPPGDDPLSGERAAERWTPQRPMDSVLCSVLALLGEPNISSPANVDAAVCFVQFLFIWSRECSEKILKNI